MSHRLRIFASMALLLGLTVLGAWFVMYRAVVDPVVKAWTLERVDTVVRLAELAEETHNPGRYRAAVERLGLEVSVLRELPEAPRRRNQQITFEREGRDVYLWRGRQMPVVVELDTAEGPRFLAVRFSTDLNEFPRRVGRGLLLLGILGLVGAAVASRWVLRPMEATREAMERVASGNLRHRVPEGSDVTGRMGVTFNHMAERIEGMIEGQRNLLAAVSHELRTPLTRMRLQLEMFRDAGVDEKRVATMEQDIDEVDVLVAALLESSRLDRGGWALERSVVPLRAVVDDAVSAVDLGERTLEIDVAEDLEVVVDRARMARALKNLLSNVARYTPDATTCRIAGGLTNEGLRIEVSDDGPGVPEGLEDQLFEPFYRVERSRSRATGGLGLGLMLVKQIVEAHGGYVIAQPSPAGGLSVVIQLPSSS